MSDWPQDPNANPTAGSPGYPPAAPGYPPAAPGYPPPAGGYVPPRTSGLAVASLVTGILSIVLCPAFGIAGLITGFSAKRKIRESNGAETGEGLATGGIVTSFIGLIFIGLAIVAIVAITFLGSSASSKFSSVGSAID